MEDVSSIMFRVLSEIFCQFDLHTCVWDDRHDTSVNILIW